ncbi:hypothetical protein [Piscinibacter gummiphilus]|jgi:hypothetical protein|uniref:Uncharacterized protein n=1 Tax=Piscinibacter gummiphilus TaxID=946333 RepID=A0ABZ0D160_9BURK|nr:hypothetical protein [Piscinibacter gummiphilus]WOB10924.1 hypothetical protein RXV79_12920 [Piscinibacter gummiphilus]
MFGLQALQQLFNPTSASTRCDSARLEELLSRGSVAVVSAACCDATSTPKDEELAANLGSALERTNLQRPVAFGTLTGTRQQLRDAGAAINAVALDFRNQLGALFQNQGLAAFPLLLVDGRIAFYGGVPSIDAIAEKLSSTLGSEAAATE